MASKKIMGITVKLGLDGKEITNNLKEIDKAVSKSSSELKQIDKALKLDPGNTELLSQKQEVLADVLGKTRQKMQELEQAQDKAARAAANYPDFQKAYTPLTESLEKAKKAVDDLQKKKEDMDEKLASGKIDKAGYDGYIQELDAAKQSLKDLNDQKKALDKEMSEKGSLSPEEYRAYRRELEQVRSQAAALETQVGQLDQAAGKTAQQFKQAVVSTEEYQRALQKLEQSSGELRSKIGGALDDILNIAVGIGGALASAAAAGVTAATKVGTSFDSSMSVVKAYSGATANEFKQLRDAAQEAGANTSKSASEAADALSFMSLAGWDTQTSLNGLMPILRASEAGNVDLARTSDLVTDSMSAMGVSVGDLKHYLDVSAQAQRSSNTSLEQLLEAYVSAGGTFKNFNVRTEESAAILGVLANRGIKGAEAGNALNSIMINLIGASKGAESALDELGVSAYDDEGNFIGMTETLRLVNDALNNCTKQQKDFFTAKLGGKTQYDTLQALLSGVSEEYDGLYEKLQNSNGALEETARIMQDNLKGDVTALSSALEGLGITVNDEFTEAWREAVQAATQEVRNLNTQIDGGSLGDSINRIASAFGAAIEKIAKFAADKAIPQTIEFFGWIADHGNLIISVISGIGGAFIAWKIGGTVLALYDFKKAVGEGITVTQAFTKVLNANPWVLLATAVAAASAALITFALNSDKAGKAIKDANKSVEDAKKATDDYISSADAEALTVERKMKQYEGLRVIQNRTAEQEEKLKGLADDLQQYMPDNITLIDEETGAYASLAGEIDNVVNNMKKKAYIEAFNNEISEIVNAEIRVNRAVADQRKELERLTDSLMAQGAKLGDDGFLDLSYFDERRDQGFEIPIDDFLAYNEAVSDVARADAAIAGYEAQIDGIQKEIDGVYEGFGASAEESFETSLDWAGDKAQEIARENAERSAQGMKDYCDRLKEESDKQQTNMDKLNSDMEELDRQKNIHAIGDDEYWAERRRILSENMDRESEVWWKYYDETEEHFKELSEQQRQAYEQQIEDKVTALKERKETSEDMTDEMFYNEFENIVNGLSKESDLYKKYNKEIAEGRQQLTKELSEEAKKQQQEQISSVSETIKGIQSEYNSKMQDIAAEQESYKNKLLGLTDIFTNDTQKDENGNISGSFTLENLDEQLKTIEKYDDRLQKLKDRGAGQGLSDYIISLSADEGDMMMQSLEKMSDSSLKAYSDKYDKLISTVNSRAQSRFQPEIDAINNDFLGKIYAAFDSLPEDMRTMAKQAVQGFVDGFTGDNTDLIEAVSEQCDQVISTYQKKLDVHSPSRVTEDFGERTGAGFEKGLDNFSGTDAAEDFADSFIKAMADKDKELYDVLYNSLAGNAEAAVNAMNAVTGDSLKNISGTLPLPDITGISIPSPRSINDGAERDNSQNTALLNDILEILNVIVQLINSLISRGNVINIDLTDDITVQLDGERLAKVVTNKQIQRERISGGAKL